jgi:hypothetical protein
MKIIDNFLFCNEYDMLELRLKIMGDYVDQFNIVECDKTFTGADKGFNLEKQLDRFSPWMHKINYIKASNPPITGNAWHIETWQRNQFSQGWKDTTDQDVMLISDCDEIIRPEAIDFIRNTDYDYYGLYMPAFYFKFNYMDTKPDWHYKIWGKAYRFKNISNINPDRLRYSGAHDFPNWNSVHVHHAGWHFGWIGDEEFAKNKIRSFSHTEVNTPEIIDNINIDKHISEGRDHFRPENVTWVPVDLDNYFPKEIVENKEKYAAFILPNSGNTVQSYWPKQIIEKE